MPPKMTAKEGAEAVKSDAAILCHILVSIPDLKLDGKSLAPILGLTSSKNVIRSLNVRLKPYGFEYKSGKILPIGQEPGEATSAAGEDGESSAAAASGTTTKAPKTPKTPKTPASKKRKLDETAEEPEEPETDGPVEETTGVVVKDEGNNSGAEV